MAIGYAAFQTNLDVKGNSQITSNWDVEIINVKEGEKTGLAESAKTPTWTKTEASMETNLYQKGDSMSYIVTIENKGSFDAKLDNINLGKGTNEEAVNITFSGYTKGQTLFKGTTTDITVTISYNPNYEGGETSSEVNTDFEFSQAEGGTITPTTDHLVTYDYLTNGGTSSNSENEYLPEGSNINLDYTAEKEGYEFIGWNTNASAREGLKDIQINEDTTLYAIFKKDLNVTYEMGDGVTSITDTDKVCSLYNNDKSCELTLPEITAKKGYEIDGWYNGDEKIGMPTDKYEITDDITLTAKAKEPEPLMMARRDNYAFWADDYRTNITSIEVLNNKDIPEDAVASWDVSAEENESVMAWVINEPDNVGKYKLYIGGNGGVIANTNLSYLFSDFTSVKTITLDILDTSRTTNMKGLFQGCSSLTNIDIFATWEVENQFDTSKVTDMSYMFQGCSSLSALYLSILKTDNVTNMSYMFQDCGRLSTLRITNMDGDVFWNTTKVTNMSHMFENCSSFGIMGANISKLNTSNVTDMSYMFSNSGDLFVNSNLDTGKVTNMEGMFKNLNLSNFQNMITGLDVSNVENMSHMFENATFLNDTPIPDLSNWDTRKVTDMSYMFAKVSGNQSIGTIMWTMNGFVTKSVTNMSHMFDGSTFNGLSLCLFDTHKVTDMSYMFANIVNPEDGGKTVSVDVNNKYWSTQNANTTNMFLNSMAKIFPKETCDEYFENSSYNMMPTFSSKEDVDKTVITITYPEGCGSTYTCTYKKNNESPTEVTSKTVNVTFTETGTLIATVKGSTNEVSNVYNVDVIPTLKSWSSSSTSDFHSQKYKRTINSVEILDNINIPEDAVESWDVSEQQDGSAMAWVIDDSENEGYYKLYIGGNGGVRTNTNSSYIFYAFENVKYVDIIKLDTSNVTNMSSMFSGCSSLTELDVSSFDTSNVTDMSSMFGNCSSLTTLDLSNFDTSSVTNMDTMFYNCSRLTSLDVSNFNTSNVTNMYYMFFGCSRLTSLDVSNFDTSSVTDMRSMFYNCSRLTSLDVSSFDTSNVTDMWSMFDGCSSLTELDVSSFATSNVTDMRSMFYNCSRLTTLDVSNFDTSNVTDMSSMFDNCSSLTELDVSSFDTSNVTDMSSMFSGCSRLTSLDVSNFNTSNVTNMNYMFAYANNLNTIYVGPNWTISNANTTNMFVNCGTDHVTQK